MPKQKKAGRGIYFHLPFLVVLLLVTMIGRFMIGTWTEDMSTSSSASLLGSPAKRDVKNLNKEILQLSTSYDTAKNSKDAASTLASLEEAVSNRRDVLADEISGNPKKFFEDSFPQSLIKKLPKKIQSSFEQEVDLEGTLSVTMKDDFEHGKHWHTVELEESGKKGSRHELHFSDDLPGIKTGDKVKVKGVALDNDVAVLPSEGDPNSPDVIVLSSPPVVTMTTKNVIVIGLKFTNVPEEPATAAQVMSTYFTGTNSVNSYYQENSYGQLGLTGDFAGWINVPYTNANCDQMWSTWANAANAYVPFTGLDLQNYQHRVYLLNGGIGCPWGGLGQLSGSISVVVANSQFLYAHELGHNLGVHHANWLNCGTHATDSYVNAYTCTSTEYGDQSDTMGNYMRQFNAPHKVEMGWLPASQQQTITTSGTYTIAPLESTEDVVKSIRIFRPYVVSQAQAYYYLSYRQPIGFDTSLPAPFTAGASIQESNPEVYKGVQTRLIDTTPGDNTSVNAPLTDGGIFTDTENGITVTQISHSSAGVVVSVQITPPPCNVGQVYSNLIPTNGSGAPLTPVVYSMTVHNIGSTCVDSTFTLTSAVPAGWAVTSNISSMQLGTGESGTVQFTVTPPAGTQNANYGIAFTATDNADTSRKAISTGTYYSYVTPIPKTVSVTLVGTGTGTVTANTPGINCGNGNSQCTASYLPGPNISLTPSAAPGSVFTGWTGDCTGTTYCYIGSVTVDKSVTAQFTTADSKTLTFTKSGSGSTGGTTSSSPVGITCLAGTPACTASVASYPTGTTITLYRGSAAGAVFDGWSGACTGTAASCVVVLDSDKTVSAQFSAVTPLVTITKTGTGTGTVASFPTGISCGTTCALSFPQGTNLSLLATPDPGYTFAGWSGGCTGVGLCSFVAQSNTSITAQFSVLPPVALTVTKSGTGTGTITSTPAGIDCGSTCSASLAFGSTVTLTATPTAGSSFAGWTGACSGTSPCTLIMSSARAVAAQFTLMPQVTLNVYKSGIGTGTITSTPGGINCGTICVSGMLEYGTPITLTAVPSGTSTFVGWSGACSGTGSCVFPLNGSLIVIATFGIPGGPYSFTVTKSGTGAGTVTTNPAGINCGSTCTTSYSAGVLVGVTATPAAGSLFVGWSGACVGLGYCTVTMDAAKSVTAQFNIATTMQTLSVSKSGAGSGTVTSAPAGINCGATCTGSFASDTSIVLTAAPAAGSTFTGWSGGVCAGTSTCSVTLNTSKSVVADFSVPQYALTVTKTGNGTITSSPAGINCGSTCNANFTGGTSVALAVTPAAGSIFAGWSGACSGTGNCVVTMDSAKSAAAVFQLASYSLGVNKSGTGTGTINSSPAGINCGTTCSANYTQGTAVTLTFAPDASSTFTGWSGACSGTGTCVVTMDAAKTVSASFQLRSFTLTVSKTGNGSGTIISSPAGIQCGTSCTSDYVYNTTVSLSAVQDSGSSFSGWTGACTGVGTCTVTMDAAKTVSAQFTVLPPQTLSVTKTGTGTGTILSTPSGVTCGATCSATFPYNTTVSLSAVQDSGSSFSGWTGACTGVGTCTVTMDAAKTVSAQFTVLPPQTLSVTKTGTGTGTILSTPSGVTCGATCSATFPYNTTVSLSAVQDSGSSFSGWTGACTGVGTCTVTMDAAKTVSAQFQRVMYVLTVNKTGNGTVTSSPAGINCGATCSASYLSNATVTLTATPTAGNVFSGWSAGCSGTGSCVITMNSARSVTAQFIANPLIVTVTSPASGAVVGNGSKFNITGTASSPSGIQSINLFVDNTKIQTCSGSPCTKSYQGNSLSDGTHTIRAEAKDVAGSTVSNSITITKQKAK